MTTALFTHPACLLHDNGAGHPESPARLQAVLGALAQPAFNGLLRREAPEACRNQLALAHSPDYIASIFNRIPAAGRVALDAETALVPESGAAALRAAGAVCAAVDAVMGGVAVNAFCAVRPPGHHAAVPPASGFCLFNTIAIGAAYALSEYKLRRVAIVDFDVHHGNGTEAWAQNEDKVLFISSYQSPLWPGSGRAQDKGALGNILNLPLPPGTDRAGFRAAISEQALPALEAFRPELILISAGFDAHRDDPLGGLRLQADDFGWVTDQLVAVATRHAQGRIVSSLEGGYDLAALAECAAAHVQGLMGAL